MLDVLVLAFVGIGCGFVLIFLLALSDKRRKARQPKSEDPLLTFQQFEKACMAIVEEMKLEIDELTHGSDAHQFDMLARNPTPLVGGQFLIHCVYLRPDQLVESPEVLEVSNMIVQERISKGLILTTGRFAEDIATLGELAPMEFIDGAAFKGLMDKYKIVFSVA